MLKKRFTYYAGGSSGFAPSDIAGLDLWLDADDTSTINGGSPTPGDQVSLWTDKSGAGNNATQGTATNQPIYQTGYLDFTSPHQLVIGDNTIGNDSTWFMVLDPDNSLTSRQVLYLNSGSYRVSITDAGVLYRVGTTNYRSGQAITTVPVMISGYVDRTTPSVTAFKDGNPSTPGTGVSSFSGGSGFVISGRVGSPANNAFRGKMNEIIRYDSALSTTDRQLVESYSRDRDWETNSSRYNEP